MDELKQVKSLAFVSWPSPQDYNEAVQNPQFSFADSNLGSSLAETDSLGLPRPITGMFASVYRMRCHDSDWALRCFLHFVPDQVERYAAISAALRKLQLASTLHFELQERGIRVRGQWFPILKMQWCEGDTLDSWLASRLYDKPALDGFLVEWKIALAGFAAAGIAHGDLQHGNVMVSAGRVSFVDYDGMYVPGLLGKLSNELGHRDYQHPRRTQNHYGPGLDNFSSWVIYLSVEILSLDPGIWEQLKGGDDCLIFRQRDFERPLNSWAFYLLEKHPNPGINQAARTLRFFLSLDPDQVPSLASEPLVPAELPELFSPPEMTSCLDEAAGENRQSEALDSFDQYSRYDETAGGLIYRAKKRPRSRMKGGLTLETREHSVRAIELTAAVELAAAEEPALSPLARLVRKVSGQAVSGEQLLFNAEAQLQVPYSTQSVQSTQIANKQPLSTHTGWSLYHKSIVAALALGLVLVFSAFIFVSTHGCQQVPSNPWLDKGDSYMCQQKFHEAAEEYERSANYFSQPHPAVQIADLTRFSSLRKLEAEANEKLGNAHFSGRHYQDAIADYSRAIELYRLEEGDSIDYARAIGLEGRAFEALDRIENAASSYGQAISIYERLGVHPALNADMSEYMAAQSRCSLASGR